MPHFLAAIWPVLLRAAEIWISLCLFLTALWCLAGSVYNRRRAAAGSPRT